MRERLPSEDNEASLHVSNYRKFITVFCSSHGAWQILVISTLYSVGIGSVLGLVRVPGSAPPIIRDTLLTSKVSFDSLRFQQFYQIDMLGLIMVLRTIAGILRRSLRSAKPVPTMPSRPRRGHMWHSRRFYCSSIPLLVH
jgi:hypothetical protein